MTKGAARPQSKGGSKSPVNKDHRMPPRGASREPHDDICPPSCATATTRLQRKTVPDIDKPGAGQFYCVSCARYYVNEAALTAHNASAKHRRRLKELTTKTPYSHEEANAARAGHDGPRTREGAPAPMSS